MPFKSQAQRRKFAQLLVEGKISNETFEEWNRERAGKNCRSGPRQSAPRASQGSVARRCVRAPSTSRIHTEADPECRRCPTRCVFEDPSRHHLMPAFTVQIRILRWRHFQDVERSLFIEDFM